MFKKKTFSSNPDQCTPQQLETLTKLRLRIRELGYPEANYEDNYLLRFLCARKFDIEKTLQMWKNFIDWRNKRNIDQITALEFPDMKAAKPYYPHTWFRTDKQGRPIFIERMGKLKTEEMLKIIPLDRVELYFIRDFEKLLKEKLPACSAAYGAPINSTCYIMDFKGASSNFMSAKVWEMLKIASKIGQDYYPETLGDMFVLNAPMVVTASWSIVKHLMDERTRTKIHILGSNYKNELLKYIDEENLPDFLGGKATEEEYGANLTNEQGPWIRGPLEEKDTEHSEIIIGHIENIEIKEEEPEILKKIQSSPFKKMKTMEEEVDELEVSQERPIRHHVRSFSAQSSLMFNLGHLVDLVDGNK